MIEKEIFRDLMWQLIAKLRITDNEFSLIKTDPNILLPIWAMFKNCDVKLLVAVCDELVENYNPETWRGETIHNGKKISCMFPYPAEFRKLKEKHYVCTIRDAVYSTGNAPIPGDNDRSGAIGLSEFIRSKIDSYRALSEDEKNELKNRKYEYTI